MNFNEFIKRGIVKKTSIDSQLIKSIIKTSDLDLKFLEDLKINEISARKVFSNYYDVLRSLLEAYALTKQYKVYSHEAFKYFLMEDNEQLLAKKFDRFRKIRNNINYYGADITVGEVNEYKNEIIELINKIKLKLK